MSTQTAMKIPSGDIPTRDQIAIEDTWDLSRVYADESAWNADAARMPDLIAAAVAYRGFLGESAARLRQALDDIMSLRRTLERLRVYAMLRRDENTADTDSLARYERSVALAIEAAEALAFVEPELLALDAARSVRSASNRAASTSRPLAGSRRSAGPRCRRGPGTVRRLYRP